MTRLKQKLKQKERKDKERKEKQSERDEVAKENELMRLEDNQFVDYAAQVIDYMRKHGRNVYPMQKVNDRLTKLFKN